MSIIPQDPIIFTGTIRFNLDPFEEFEEKDIWEVLSFVQLKEVVSEMKGQLDAEIQEGGENFSVGQRQLLCFARALLKRNQAKILVLDEATSSVDTKTDMLIQTALRTHFKGHTILTIAHRLNTIMDYDRILVMDAGKAAEFDSPRNLLKKKDGIFYGMVMQTGKQSAERMKQIAKGEFDVLASISQEHKEHHTFCDSDVDDVTNPELSSEVEDYEFSEAKFYMS